MAFPVQVMSRDQAITGVVATSGGFIVSLKDGTISGPSDDFAAMRLTHAQHQRGTTYLGFSGSALVAMAGSTANEPNSIWPAAASAQGTNAATDPLAGIWAKGHLIEEVFGFKHVSIRLVPQQRHQQHWRKERSNAFVDHPSDDISNTIAPGITFATIGAGSSQLGGASCGGSLLSAVNRKTDVENPPASTNELVRLKYSPIRENLLISKFFALDDNYRDDLEYECIPEMGQYNSNSYAAGLIKAAGLPPPDFPNYGGPILTPNGLKPPYVGWSTPVPAQNFEPTR